MMKHPETVFSAQVEHEAQQALEEFLIPARKPLSEPEQALLERATSLSVPFGSMNINVFRWGKGSTIFLVHGWGGYGLQLGEFVNPLLKAEYQVLAFDAPAHGSTAGVQTSGLELAQAIATIAQHQGSIEGIIAHSLGAASTTLALSEGMKAHKVVYLGAICRLVNTATIFAKRARLSTETEGAFRRLFEARFGQDIWQRFAIDQTVKNLSIPALLFHDHGDREVSFEESKTIAQAWPSARLIETSGLGHRRILRNMAVIQQTVDFLTIPA
jgi:pimeloyl-ACP methyl ester carboxylesterase